MIPSLGEGVLTHLGQCLVTPCCPTLRMPPTPWSPPGAGLSTLLHSRFSRGALKTKHGLGTSLPAMESHLWGRALASGVRMNSESCNHCPGNPQALAPSLPTGRLPMALLSTHLLAELHSTLMEATGGQPRGNPHFNRAFWRKWVRSPSPPTAGQQVKSDFV